jgi:hypothetical protein
VFTRTQIDPFILPANIRAKWSDELLGEGFVPLPKKLLRTLSRIFGGSPEIEELVALLAAVDYKRATPAPPPTLAYLAFAGGLSVSRFKSALSRLKKKGLVNIDIELANDTVDVNLNGLNRAVAKIISEDRSRASGVD